MANRRMISNAIVKSARFLKMPPTSQNLYFHLIMNADDDGVVEAFPIMRMVGSTEDDLKILMDKTFVFLLNEDLVTFINNWTEHNKIRKDRKVDSVYKDLLLKIVSEIDYREAKKKEMNNDSQVTDSRQTNVSIGKDRLGKDSIGKSSREEGIKKIYHYYESNGFGTLAQKTMQDFDYWIKDLMKIGATEENAIEIIIHSLGIAVDRNKRNYGYAYAILKDWEQKGFTKVSDILANDKKNTVTEPKMPDYSLPDEFKNQFDDIKEPDFEMPY